MFTPDTSTQPRFSLGQVLDTWLGTIVLLPFCLWFATHRGEYTLLDNADLIIHEAGHFFAQPFGTFAMFAGGTLMQIALPWLLVWHFRRNDYAFGTQVSLVWLGQNLINISVYAADAQARALPLLGGDAAQHDWWNMLSRLGLLEWDQTVGWAFFALALVMFGRALWLPRFVQVETDWVRMV